MKSERGFVEEKKKISDEKKKKEKKWEQKWKSKQTVKSSDIYMWRRSYWNVYNWDDDGYDWI